MVDEKNFKRITGNISKELAVKMTEAYDKTRRSGNVDGFGKPDTKSVYINKVELLAFLDANPNAKGIRVYFGIVDHHGITQNAHHLKKYKKQTTIILMPTESSEKLLKEAVPFMPAVYKEGEPFDESDLCPPPPIGASCDEIQ